MNHTQLIHATIKVADEVGCILWRNETVRGKGARGRWLSGGMGRGSPDLTGCETYYFGRFIGVECKVGKDTVNEEQGMWLRAMLINQAMVYVVRPDTLETFRKSLMLTAEGQQPHGTPSKVDVPRQSWRNGGPSFLDLPDMARELPMSGKEFEYKLGAHHNVRLQAQLWQTTRA